MALTVTESNAVNTLCDYLLTVGSTGPGGESVSAAKTQAALALLVDHADRVLHAGWRAAEVPRAWDRLQALLERGRRPDGPG